ncbi:methyltransferase TYW3-domain-containing protein [Hypoxylon sp. FL1284]|nr:methyltransferase TYW3-domain-containing protein [Hypoxylon sp. FL1284]
MREPTPVLAAAAAPHFAQRKRRILEQLAAPEAEYTDASPKGSVDAGIRDLIDEINGLEGFVTTSSCAGRVSVFVEGSKKKREENGLAGGQGEDEEEDGGDHGVKGDDAKGAAAEDEDAEVGKLAGVGGKGGGGAWLFVSHDPVALDGDDSSDLTALLGLRGSSDTDGAAEEHPAGDVAATRFIHFKFEPMILHVLTASPDHAQLLLRCGLQAGFRESGAVSLTATTAGGDHQQQQATPIVGVRSMGLALESLVGYWSGDGNPRRTVSPDYLRTLVRVANDRFVENRRRIDRFRAALALATRPSEAGDGGAGDEWEDAQARRERKRAEGLRRREELRGQRRDGSTAAVGAAAEADDDTYLDGPLDAGFT